MNPSPPIVADELPLSRTIAPTLTPMAEDAPVPGHDLAALTEAMRRGDEAAWRDFHGRYFARLQRYLLVVLRGDEYAAQEALQQTFLRAVRHVRRFDSEPIFWHWLAVLARSAAVDEQRKHARQRSLLERWFQSRPADDSTPLDADGRLGELLEKAIAALPPDERALVESKYLDGASVRELAVRLDTTEKAVDSRLVRLRRKLKTGVLACLNHEH